jgi:hypothetical protein
MCALAHQVHAMVSALFDKDHDGLVSAEEFINGPLLRPHFRQNVRVPVRKGDIVRVRDLCVNNADYKKAVVVGWYQRAHWNHANNALNKTDAYHKKKKGKGKSRKINMGGFSMTTPGKGETVSPSKLEGIDENKSAVLPPILRTAKHNSPGEDLEDNGPVIYRKSVDVGNFFFSNGTIFLVRLLEDRESFTRGKVVLPRPNKVHFELLNKGEIHAVPETAIYWKEIKCNEFVRGMLEQSDWLFDSDGTCAINDHRCVPLSASRHPS